MASHRALRGLRRNARPLAGGDESVLQEYMEAACAPGVDERFERDAGPLDCETDRIVQISTCTIPPTADSRFVVTGVLAEEGAACSCSPLRRMKAQKRGPHEQGQRRVVVHRSHMPHRLDCPRGREVRIDVAQRERPLVRLERRQGQVTGRLPARRGRRDVYGVRLGKARGGKRKRPRKARA